MTASATSALGAWPVTAAMNGRSFPGTNLWYVEQQPNSGWGAPVHVDGPLNDGAMIYNPSVAANGDIYFSAHRADSGKAYQIYVARDHGHAMPEQVPLGDPANNRMDPAVDPAARRYQRLSFDRVLDDRLGVMDATAIVLCRDNRLPLRVFNLNNPGDLPRVVRGEDVGTLVTHD